jgi:hypothetical protein
MMSKSLLLSWLLPLALLAGPAVALRGADVPAPARTAPYDPAEQYEKRRIEGWEVLVNKRLLAKEQAELCDETLKLLGDHLYRITRVVPAEAVAKLRKVPIWVELAHPRHPCMCYHVSAGWLREHAMNPQKAGAVEIANARTFLAWTHEQPWMVLHELAHAYHHQVLGFDHAEVKACYERAVSSRSYESVLHVNGRKVRHYALTNDHEYFAEATEAFFGTNDFFPFVRAELRQHDPAMYELLEKVWGVRKPDKE